MLGPVYVQAPEETENINDLLRKFSESDKETILKKLLVKTAELEKRIENLELRNAYLDRR